ncbi:class I SAM-dependent methyltransferase [Streptomyces buecherae]|uniref:class I SAM-dependent methyltransferase n=1 Tax=Streptomyces buecherae TaxID=2763006 RepID=UPI0037A524B0
MDEDKSVPDHTAVRVALWRALHVRVDPPPHVLRDEVGLRLAGPGANWRRRPDMDPLASGGARAAIVARARFVEDLVAERAGHGVDQYVVLGAGLDSFAQRRPQAAAGVRVFEIDQPATQAWKRRRLAELGYPTADAAHDGPPHGPHLVPVDFEAGEDWWERLADAGFDRARPAVVACTGVTLYLTKEATADTLRRLARLAPGSTLAMTFLLPAELIDPADRAMLEATKVRARAAGTPFIGFYAPDEMLALARDAGFRHVRHLPGATLADRYFADRTDGLRPSSGEDFLLASV